MIVIIPPVFDSAGNLRLHERPGSQLDAFNVRASSRKALNGGVILENYGVTAGDSHLKVLSDVGEDVYRQLRLMMSRYSRFFLSCRHGFFEAIIVSLNFTTTLEMTIYIKEIKT